MTTPKPTHCVEYLNDYGFQTELFTSESDADRYAQQLEQSTPVTTIFVFALCPKCGRSQGDPRTCRHVFHELTADEWRNEKPR